MSYCNAVLAKYSTYKLHNAWYKMNVRVCVCVCVCVCVWQNSLWVVVLRYIRCMPEKVKSRLWYSMPLIVDSYGAS